MKERDIKIFCITDPEKLENLFFHLWLLRFGGMNITPWTESELKHKKEIWMKTWKKK